MKTKIFLITTLLCASTMIIGQTADTTAMIPVVVEKPMLLVKAKRTIPDSTEVWFSNGYFGWMKSNDPIENAKRAQSAAEVFKVAHPDQYQAIAHDSPKVLWIPKAEFESMTAEKRAWILSKPEKFQVLDPNEN